MGPSSRTIRWVALLALASACRGGGASPDAGAPAPLVFVTLSAHNHTCGITWEGNAYCWGWNSDGALGDGTREDRFTPTPVAGELLFGRISTGRSLHTCAVGSSGTAYCWGANGSGQLGDGTVTARLTPTPVAGGLTFTQVSTALHHACAVSPGRVAYCWGANGSGQLGDGTTTSRTTPVPVGGGLSFAQISAADVHTCGVTTQGHAYCWGANDFFGRLGDGTLTQRTLPSLVAGGLSFRAVSAGAGHTCGLAVDNRAYCWGTNVFGQLGDGTTEARTTPTAVAGGLRFASLTASPTGDFTCGVTTDGLLYCWGLNDKGEFGNGSATSSPVPVASGTGLKVAQVAPGAAHTCALTSGGETYCWGYNGLGRLGDGTTESHLVPVRVAGP